MTDTIHGANQQERLYFYIGYIIGMIDGEGSYQLQSKQIKNGVKYYAPKIGIFNNNPNIIQQVINALGYLEIPFHVWTPTLKGNELRVVYRIQITGIKRVKKLTDLILKYQSGKAERAKLLNDFCNYRLSFTEKELSSGHITTYSYKEEEFHDKLKDMNLLYRGTKSSETIRFNIVKNV